MPANSIFLSVLKPAVKNDWPVIAGTGLFEALVLRRFNGFLHPFNWGMYTPWNLTGDLEGGRYGGVVPAGARHYLPLFPVAEKKECKLTDTHTNH
jgi:hypothetical protein